MTNSIKIAIAEDHLEYRDLLVGIFLKYRFAVVADGSARPRFIKQLDPGQLPHVIVAGCSILHPGGLALVHQLKDKYPSIKILAIALFYHYLPAKQLVDLEVEGWLMKSTCEPKLLVKAVSELYKGRHFYHNVEDYFVKEYSLLYSSTNIP